MGRGSPHVRRRLRVWLKPDIEKLAGEEQERFCEEDVWSTELAAWVRGQDRPFTLASAMCSSSLGYESAARIPKPDQMRASACLKGLGYRRRKTRTGKQTAWLWTASKSGNRWE